MNFFRYQGSELFAEEVPLRTIADEVGTPCYVYSLATLRRHYRVFDEAFAAAPHLVCYSVKANSNLAVLARLRAAKAAASTSSRAASSYRALAAGADPRKIVFSGVGKTRDEMAYALGVGILAVQRRVGGGARPARRGRRRDRQEGAGRAAGQSRRRPQDPSLHLDRHEEVEVRDRRSVARSSEYERAKSLEHLEVDRRRLPHRLAADRRFAVSRRALRAFAASFSSSAPAASSIRYLDIGGGLGITYSDETPPTPKDYADAVARRWHRESRRHTAPRARARARRQRRHPAHAGPLLEADRDQEVRDRRRRDERSHPPVALRRLPGDRAGDAAASVRRPWSTSSDRSARAATSSPRTASSQAVTPGDLLASAAPAPTAS